METNAEVTKVMRDTTQSFSGYINQNLDHDTVKMGTKLNDSVDLEQEMPGHGVQNIN